MSCGNQLELYENQPVSLSYLKRRDCHDLCFPRKLFEVFEMDLTDK